MRFRPALAATLVAGVVCGALSGCAGSGSGAAQDAAERYLDLIATADEADLETLWSASFTEDPAALRIAGDLLAGATDRIEVVEVGDATPADDPSIPIGLSGLVDTGHLRQVRATYALAGTDHDIVLRLVPTVGADLDDPDSWLVLDAPLGSLAWPIDGPDTVAVPVDAYVSGVRSVLRQDQPLYPAVYSVQERVDPYLDAEPADVAVPAGAATPPPSFTQQVTEAAVDALAASVISRFDTCVSDVVRCPVRELVERGAVSEHPVEDPWTEDWWGGITTPPTLTVTAGRYTSTDGVFTYTATDGTRLAVPFSIDGEWAFDNRTRTPAVSTLTIAEVTP